MIMDLITYNKLGDIFLTGDGGQLTGEVSDDGDSAESSEEEGVRYGRLIRELTDFEAACEGSTDSALEDAR
jgi:hypothetical protein